MKRGRLSIRCKIMANSVEKIRLAMATRLVIHQVSWDWAKLWNGERKKPLTKKRYKDMSPKYKNTCSIFGLVAKNCKK